MRESYQHQIDAGLVKRYQTLEYEIQSDIVRRIKKARKITSTADWQIERIRILGKSSRDIKKIVASAVQYDDGEVDKLYKQVVADEYTANKSKYEQITGKFVKYEDNLELQQIVAAIKKNSTEELTNITRSMGFMIDFGNGPQFTDLSDTYNKMLDQAVVDMTSGAFDYNTVIRRACKQLTDSGLRTSHPFSTNPQNTFGVDYPSGWHNRIDVAARRAIMTGTSQLTGHIMDMNAEWLHVDKFEVSWHVGARPEHAAWQGKVYTRKQLETVCGLGTGDGLLGWNCRHEYYLFFDDSTRTYTDEWLEAQNRREAEKKSFRGHEYNTYEATQKQRRMETNMRAQREKVKLMQAGDADPDDIVIEKCKYQAQLDEYKEFSAAFNMPTQTERIYYDLNGRVAPSRKKYNQIAGDLEETYHKGDLFANLRAQASERHWFTKYAEKYPGAELWHYRLNRYAKDNKLITGEIAPPVKEKAVIGGNPHAKNPNHIIDRMKERGVTSADAQSYVDNAEFMQVQRRGNGRVYYAADGATNLVRNDDAPETWYAQTAWTKGEYDENVKKLMDEARRLHGRR